jgi:hypothetical protein
MMSLTASIQKIADDVAKEDTLSVEDMLGIASKVH